MATATETLALIDAAIATLATDGIASLAIGGRTITYQSAEGLLKLRKEYAALASQEAVDAGTHAPLRSFGFRLGRAGG